MISIPWYVNNSFWFEITSPWKSNKNYVYFPCIIVKFTVTMNHFFTKFTKFLILNTWNAYVYIYIYIYMTRPYLAFLLWHVVNKSCSTSLFTKLWSKYVQFPFSSLCWWTSTIMLMGWCKEYVTPLLTQWSYVFLALTGRCVSTFIDTVVTKFRSCISMGPAPVGLFNHISMPLNSLALGDLNKIFNKQFWS